MTIKLNQIQLALLVLLFLFSTFYIIYSYFVISYLLNEIDASSEVIAKLLSSQEKD